MLRVNKIFKKYAFSFCPGNRRDSRIRGARSGFTADINVQIKDCTDIPCTFYLCPSSSSRHFFWNTRVLKWLKLEFWKYGSKKISKKLSNHNVYENSVKEVTKTAKKLAKSPKCQWRHHSRRNQLLILSVQINKLDLKGDGGQLRANIGKNCDFLLKFGVRGTFFLSYSFTEQRLKVTTNISAENRRHFTLRRYELTWILA